MGRGIGLKRTNAKREVASKLRAAMRAQRHAAKQELSAAVTAENWDDRPESGKSRPTPQRMAKGVFVLRDGEDAGVTVAVDENATMLDRLCADGVIEPAQRDGGLSLAALLHRTRLTKEGRSCLDFSPVGHDGGGEPTHAELRDSQERAEIYLACGVATFRELRSVCLEGHTPRNINRLRSGLDICARFWDGGLPKRKK